MNSLLLDMTTVVGTAVGAYLWLILVLRLSGKRSLAKLNAFDFVVTVAFGSTLSAVIVSRDVGLTRGLTALAILAILQLVLSKLSVHWKWLRRTVRARPTLLLEDGRMISAAMQHARITEDELAQVVRREGYGRFDQVGAVVLETSGSFSVIAKSDQPIELLSEVKRLGTADREAGR